MEEEKEETEQHLTAATRIVAPEADIIISQDEQPQV